MIVKNQAKPRRRSYLVLDEQSSSENINDVLTNAFSLHFDDDDDDDDYGPSLLTDDICQDEDIGEELSSHIIELLEPGTARADPLGTRLDVDVLSSVQSLVRTFTDISEGPNATEGVQVIVRKRPATEEEDDVDVFSFRFPFPLSSFVSSRVLSSHFFLPS